MTLPLIALILLALTHIYKCGEKCIHLSIDQFKRMCRKNYQEEDASISDLFSENDEEVDVN